MIIKKYNILGRLFDKIKTKSDTLKTDYERYSGKSTSFDVILQKVKNEKTIGSIFKSD